MFVWGYGILGKGPIVEHSAEPTEIPASLFGRNEFNPDSKVVSIYGGLSQFAAITDTGDLYIWGRNRHGSLGLGHLKNQFFPIKVESQNRLVVIELTSHFLECRCASQVLLKQSALELITAWPYLDLMFRISSISLKR